MPEVCAQLRTQIGIGDESSHIEKIWLMNWVAEAKAIKAMLTALMKYLQS